MLRSAAIAALAGALACGGGSSAPDDGGSDAGFDAGLDAPMDSFVPDVPLADGGADAPVVDVGVDSTDAGCDCPDPGECSSFACIDGVCVEAFVDDGTLCGEVGSICVAGSCVMRGCGDGYREPGPTPARESCDDGNLDDSDLCDSFCMSQDYVAAVDPEEFWDARVAVQAPAVGVDGVGNALAVWSEQFAGDLEMRGRVFSPTGAPIGDPFLIESRGIGTVVGLRGGGWVVAYSANRGSPSSNDIVARVISVDGTVGSERILNAQRMGDQRNVRLASLGDGFVAVWFDMFNDPADPDFDGGTYARRFNAGAGPLDADDIRIATETAGVQRNARIASDGDTWMVVYENAFFHELLVPTLMGRRYNGATPIDSAPFEIAPPDSRYSSVTGRSMPFDDDATGEFAVVFEREVPGPSLSDIYIRLIPSGAPSTFPDEMLWTDSGPRDVNNWIAPLPSGELIASSELTTREADVLTSGTFAPEIAALRTALDSFENDISIAPSPHGTWVSWLATPMTATVPLRLFLLPHE